MHPSAHTPVAQPSWVTARQDRLDAEGLLRAFEVREAPVPVEEIAKRLGVSVHPISGRGWDGALRSTEGEAHIWVDSTMPVARKRFTIAHELGHLLLHPLGVEYRDATSARGTEPREIEANDFAARLLMPGWMLRAYMQATTDIAKLARLFGVSEQAMAIRLKSYFNL